MLINNLIAIFIFIFSLGVLYGAYRLVLLLLQRSSKLSASQAKITSAAIVAGVATVIVIVLTIIAANGFSDLPNQ